LRRPGYDLRTEPAVLSGMRHEGRWPERGTSLSRLMVTYTRHHSGLTSPLGVGLPRNGTARLAARVAARVPGARRKSSAANWSAGSGVCRRVRVTYGQS
jgi:hypothetical protein